jgi:CubicO group peptidase (beta-lactamase class C family)
MAIMRTIAIVLMLFAGRILSQGQPHPAAMVDSLFTSLEQQDLFSGAVLIADSTGILLAKGYGYADRENKIKNSPDTRFSLSSGSKIFTGTAITYLAQKGRLKFTDPVGYYIKGLPQGETITLHQLLTHSAGFDDFFHAKDFSYANVKNCTDMMPFMRSMPLVYNPGDSCIYSTGNCIVLGAVVEKVTGMNFPDYIRTTFLNPLNMQNTHFTAYWTLPESQRQYAVGYTQDDQQHYIPRPYNYDPGFIPLSAGGAWSSILDLYTFDHAVFSGRVVSPKYLKRMTTGFTPQWDNAHFGYMWIVTDKKGYYSIGHEGSSSGWHTLNEYYPKQQYTIIILTNFGSVDVSALGSQVEDILFAPVR